MARTKVKLNGRGVQEYLDGKHGIEALLQDEAEERLERAKASAPVVTGSYRDSIHIETDHTDRMVKRVVADAPHALVVEANTGNMARSL